jgi:drug/metabolite transporter (DMT)-like permease
MIEHSSNSSSHHMMLSQDEESTQLLTSTSTTATTTSPMTTRVEFANLLLLPTSAFNHTSTITQATSTDGNSADVLPDVGNGTGGNGVILDRHTEENPQQQQQQQQQQPSSSLSQSLQGEAVVVLQARMETCQELIAAAAAAVAATATTAPYPIGSQYHSSPPLLPLDSSSILSPSNYLLNGTSQLQPQQLQQQPPPAQILSPITQIQGVVDLDALSAIVGVSRSDIETDWRPQQQQQQQQQQPQHTSTSVDAGSAEHASSNALPPSFLSPNEDTPHLPPPGNDDENDIVEVPPNQEGTPLLMPSPVSSASYQADIIPYTLSPVYTNNNSSSNNMDHIILDTVLLNADAFVETLADVLDVSSTQQNVFPHRYRHRDSENEIDDDNDIESMTQDDFDGDLTTNYDDVSGVTPGGAFFVPRPENLGANLRSNRQHAFLLEIPSLPLPHHPNHHNYHSMSSNVSDVPSHFILAIPKQDGTGLWQDDVSEASNDNNDNDSFLLGLSHLPTDVCDVQIEATQYTDTETIRLDVVVKRQVPVIGYVILIGGLLALSSVGTALNLQQNVSPIMKSFWRYTTTWIVLLPIAIRSLQQHHNQSSGYIPLSGVQWLYFVICAMCYAFMTTAFVSALEYTTLANAFVLSNLAPLFIIVGRTVLGYSVLYMEGIGAMIGFFGGTICTLDRSPTINGNGIVRDHPMALFGDSLAIMASAAVAIYLILAKKLRPHIDLFVFTFLLMLTSSIFVLAYMILTKEPMSFSNHIDHGLWGWANWQWNRLPLELYLAIVCNIMGTMGYIAVMKYFEPIVVSTVMLSEPVLGALMAALVGSDPLPGWQTWIGNVVVAVGIFLVIWSGARSTETIDATKALMQVNSNHNNNSENQNYVTAGSSAQGTPHHPVMRQKGHANPNLSTGGVPLLKNHPVKAAAMNSPHRLRPPNTRMRSESMY